MLYNFPEGDEQPKVQKVPTKDMSQDLNIMLDVIKNWENFNYEDFMKEMVKRYGWRETRNEKHWFGWRTKDV